MDAQPPGAGKYEVVRALGRGAMGEVYLARDQRLQRNVALKVIRADLPAGDWQERIAREARLLAQLNHPNIVQIYDITEHEGAPALVMEYVDGRNLRIHLREQRVELGDRLRWLAEIATGLAASHAAGISHCDLKFENVLIDARGTAKVTDFGIAGADSDAAADIAALGRMAEELLQEQQALLSPLARELLRDLAQPGARKRLDVDTVANRFRHIWYEYGQDETPLPQDLVAPYWTPRRRWLAVGAGTAATVAIVALLLWWQRPAPVSYVAVMPPQFAAAGTDRQSSLLALSVRQALQESVIDAEGLALVSFSEQALSDGNARQQLASLGADSLLKATLDCSPNACDLQVERLQAPDGAVSGQITLALLPAAAHEAREALARQWPTLFPGHALREVKASAISDEQYRRYLELRLARDRFEQSGSALLETGTALLAEVDDFAPLYQLYIELALFVFEMDSHQWALDDADAALRRMQDRTGNSLYLQRGLFDTALLRKDFERAAAAVSALEDVSSDRALASYLRGQLDYHQGNHNEAEQYYARAVAINPAMDYYYAGARNLFFAGRAEAALTLLEEMRQRYPRHVSAMNLEAVIKINAGDVDGAIALLEQSIAIQPDASLRANLGTLHLLQGDYAAAREQYLAAYEAGSRDSVLVLNLADAYQLLGDGQQAQGLYHQLVQRFEDSDPTLLPEVAAQAYAQLGDFTSALAVLRNQQDEWADLGMGAFAAAVVYGLSGQHLAAVVEVDEAIKQGMAPSFFNLPWFNPLCGEARFSEVMAAAGAEGRCEGVTP